MRKRYALLAAACAGVLLAAEAGIRLFSPHGIITPESLAAQSLQYEPSAFSKGVFPRRLQEFTRSDGTRVRINAQGFRGSDISAPKSPGVARIMFYGGSSVFDYMMAEGKDWPHRVEALLRQRGVPAEAINAGIPGHASFDCLERLYTEGHAFLPDVLVLYAGWNDMAYLRKEETLLRQVPPAQCTRDPLLGYQGAWDKALCRLSQLYVRLRYRYLCRKLSRDEQGRIPAGEYAAGPSESGLRQYRLTLQTFADVARNIGALPVLVTEARLVAPDNGPGQKKLVRYYIAKMNHEGLCESYARMDRMAKEIARDKDIPLIDASALLSGRDAYFVDHVHLSDAGSQALAEIVAGGLASRIREQFSTRDNFEHLSNRKE